MSSESCVHSGGVVLSLIQYTENNSKINRDLSYVGEGIFFTTNNVTEGNKRMCFTKDLLITIHFYLLSLISPKNMDCMIGLRFYLDNKYYYL